MTAALTYDIRLLIIMKRAAGPTRGQVSIGLEISKSSISRIPRHAEQTGSVPRPKIAEFPASVGPRNGGVAGVHCHQ